MEFLNFTTYAPPLRTTTVPLNTLALAVNSFCRRLLRQLFLDSKSLYFLIIVGESANPLQKICREVQNQIGGKSVSESATESVSVTNGIQLRNFATIIRSCCAKQLRPNTAPVQLRPRLDRNIAEGHEGRHSNAVLGRGQSCDAYAELGQGPSCICSSIVGPPSNTDALF